MKNRKFHFNEHRLPISELGMVYAGHSVCIVSLGVQRCMLQTLESEHELNIYSFQGHFFFF